MSKEITSGELAEIVTSLLVGSQASIHLDSTEKYAAFMTDLAQLICDHCGGAVNREADNTFEQWLVGIRGNDSLPEDGGIWKDYDPDGELDTETIDVCPSCGREYDDLSNLEKVMLRREGICPADDCPGHDK